MRGPANGSSPEVKPIVAVVGPGSMMGRELVQLLSEQGYRIIRCGRSPDSDIRLDLAASALPPMEKKLNADVLFHCAAVFGDDSWEGCRLNERVNALGSYLVAELAESLGCKAIVYAGSIFSYANQEGRLDSYGSSKARGEEILAWSMHRVGGSFASLRFSQLYDDNGLCCRHQPWFGRIVAYANSGQNLRMPGGDAKRNYLHVQDAVKMLLIVAEKRMAGIFPATAPESYTPFEIAKLAYEVFAKGGKVELAPEKAPFRGVPIPDSEETYKKLDYVPEIGIREGLMRIQMAGTADRFGPMDVE